MVNVGRTILEKELASLHKLFQQFLPDATCSSAVAKHRLLHLPLVALIIGKFSSGIAEVYLLEASKNLDSLNCPAQATYV